jgi:hypothetical protein
MLTAAPSCRLPTDSWSGSFATGEAETTAAALHNVRYDVTCTAVPTCFYHPYSCAAGVEPVEQVGQEQELLQFVARCQICYNNSSNTSLAH